jgi:hypothetical protein
MGVVLYSASMTGVFILANLVVGNQLRHGGRPYGAVRLSVHELLFALVCVGYVVTMWLLQAVRAHKFYSVLALGLTGFALGANLVVGVLLARGRGRQSTQVWWHKRLSELLVVSIAVGIFFLRWRL